MSNLDKLTSESMNNPYIVIQENNEVNRLSLCKGLFIAFAPLFIIIFITIGPIILFARLGMPFLIPIFIAPSFLILFCCKSKIVLIKDKANNSFTVEEKNYFCCKKSYSLPLEYTDIKTKGDGNESGPCCQHDLTGVIVLNINPNVIDIDSNNIKNTPFKFIYRFSNIIGSYRDLELELTNFIGSKFKNNIEEEINIYVPNYNKNNNQFNITFHFKNLFNKTTDRFIKISDHFYMFYNYNYLLSKSSNENFRRLDWIYTHDFDRIFLGVVKNDKTYLNTATYSIDSIDKFVLEIKDGKFCLKVMLKDGLNAEICRYTRDQESHLNTFIYLINGQINKINNKNNNDYPKNKDNSAPTIE